MGSPGLSAPLPLATRLPKGVDAASEQLLYDFVEREATGLTGPRMAALPRLTRTAEGSAPQPRPPAALGDVTSALDCQHATHDITLDPVTGETTATLELR